MTKTIAITSGKGGVGKSNVAVNLSIQLGRLGRDVCLFDADLGLANANILLGLYPDNHLDDLIDGRAEIVDIIMSGQYGIDIIPGSSGLENMANLSSGELSRLFDSFSYLDKYDYLVFDTSSGIHDHVLSFCQAADDLVVVITPEPTSLIDAYALLKVLSRNGYTGDAGIIINKCRNKEIAKATYRRFRSVVKSRLPVKLKPLGMILRDAWMEAAVAEQKPLLAAFPDAVSSKCIRLIANRLVSDGKPGGEDIAGFWNQYFDRLNAAGHIPEEDGRPEVAETPTTDGTNEAPQAKAEIAGDGSGEPDLPEKHGDAWTGLRIHPRILVVVLEEVSGGAVDAGRLAGLIGLDPGFAFQVLLSANTDRTPGDGEMVDLREAVRRLGADAIRGMALSASAGYVSQNGAGTPGAEYAGFLRHSVHTAVLAAKIASHVPEASVGEAYIAGLFHDLGFMVEKDRYRLGPGSYGKIPWEKEEKAQYETGAVRPRHCEIGSDLIRKWNLPPLVADAVLYHHESEERIRDAFSLPRIIHLADVMARDDLDLKKPGLEAIYGFSGLTRKRLGQIRKSAALETDKRLADVGVIGSSGSPAGYLRDTGILMRGVNEAARLDGFARRSLAAGNRAETARAIRIELALLFGIRHSVVFITNFKGDRLRLLDSTNSESPASYGRMEVDVDAGAGLLADAFQSGETRYFNSDAGTNGMALVDEQLLRLLGGNALLCEPLMLAGGPLGVIAAGMDRREMAAVLERLPLLHALASRAASAMARFGVPTEKTDGEDTPEAGLPGVLPSIHKVRDGLRGLENSMRSENGTRDRFNEIRVHIDLIESMIDEILDVNEDSRFNGPPVKRG